MEISFSNPVEPVPTNLQSFLINDDLIPTSVTIKGNDSYLLGFNRELENGSHIIRIKGLRDYYNSPIPDTTVEFNININKIPQTEFFISNFSINDNKTVNINFNLNIDTVSAISTSNYTVDPKITIRDIILSSKSSIRLKFDAPIINVGRQYNLNVKDVFSSHESGYLKISPGAGSFISLLDKSESLKNLYVDPNPFKFEHDGDIITFANLTAKCELNIYDIRGKFVKKIVEEDSDGGISWNLQDESGKIISSGIYIYSVKSLDEFERVKEQKMGKFAIVK
jgi:hypothetical protein